MPTKICTICKKEKKDEDFAWKYKDIRRSSDCKDCHKIYQRSWYRRHRREHMAVIARKVRLLTVQQRKMLCDYLANHPCVDCGENDIVVLEFDHRYDKTEAVARMVGKYSWHRIEQEIEKCDVRCANCHRRRTAKQFGHYRAIVAESGRMHLSFK